MGAKVAVRRQWNSTLPARKKAWVKKPYKWKPGKRTKARAAARRELKPLFERAGITRCELCGRDNYLGFAHSKKSKDIITDADWLEVALLCTPCHDKIEGPTNAMRPKILAIIEARKVPLENS